MCGMLGYPESEHLLSVFPQMLLSQVSIGPILTHHHGLFLQSLKKDNVTTYPWIPLPPPHETQCGLPPAPASAELGAW